MTTDARTTIDPHQTLDPHTTLEQGTTFGDPPIDSDDEPTVPIRLPPSLTAPAPIRRIRSRRILEALIVALGLAVGALLAGRGALDDAPAAGVLAARHAPGTDAARAATWRVLPAAAAAGDPGAIRLASLVLRRLDARDSPADVAAGARGPARDLNALYERYLAHGHKLFNAGRAKAALKWYRKAARLIPADDRAWWAIGRAYHDRGLNAKAARYLEKALRLNPRSEMAHLVLGSVYQEEADVAAATSSYETYLAMAPAGELTREASSLVASLKPKALDLRAGMRVGPTFVAARAAPASPIALLTLPAPAAPR
ncbi:MAG TPA: tetratricopeptide repeat protein [Myxococcota bacterium]|nr:tetratricopeptide repeat protein [Myxococcota bacterium]